MNVDSRTVPKVVVLRSSTEVLCVGKPSYVHFVFVACVDSVALRS